jgi:regulator of cell morphogenesis and NO signaling
MKNLTTLSLGDIVKQNYKAAQVLERFELDFCCMGHQMLEEACANKNLDSGLVIEALEEINIYGGDGVDFGSWPLDLLADYIYQKHHRYIEEKTPQIKQYLDKLCNGHRHNHPELEQIRQLFKEIARELSIHVKMEELILFPYIKQMIQSKQSNTPLLIPDFGTVDSPVQRMKSDYMNEGEKLMKISSLTNNYTPPADECNTYLVTFKLLQEYERDIHMHIHLKNNILFAKSIQLEGELLGQLI